MTQHEQNASIGLSRRDFGKITGLGIAAFGANLLGLDMLLEPPEISVFASEIAGSDKGRALENIRRFFEKDAIVPRDVFRLNIATIYHFGEIVDKYKVLYPYTKDDEWAHRDRPRERLGQFIREELQNEHIYDGIRQLSDVGNPKHRLSFDGALEHLDQTYIKGGRPMECIGGVILFSSLHLPISPEDISGSTGQASGILSTEGREALKQYHSFVDKKWGFLFHKITEIGQVMVGDIFIRYGNEDEYNHMGVVIGRKVIDDDTRLLVADANRSNDGRIQVSEVNWSNFADVFGSGRNRPIVVLKNPDVPKSFAAGT